MRRFVWKLTATSLAFASMSSLAVCPPVVPCKPTAEASTIAGSNADQKLIAFTQNITTSTNEVAKALVDMANANAGALQQNAQGIVSTSAELSQIQLGQELKLRQAMASREMAHKAELSEQKYREQVSVVSKDDTKEEFQLILDVLKDNPTLPVPKIINILSMGYDKNPDGKVLVPLKSAEGICSEEDIKQKGTCSIAKKVYPGTKLQSLFRECSTEKRILKEKDRARTSKTLSVASSSKKTAKAMQTTNSAAAVGARIQKQRALSCSPTEFKNKVCGNMSVEDYQEKIVVGDIIPNGDVSASNFSTPSNSSGDGYIDDLTVAERAQVRQQMLDRTEMQAMPTQKIVPIYMTYRNANQVKAAMDFVDNAVGDDLVPALDPTSRKYLQNAEYQSRHMTRLAALSMARLALNDSMSMRVGEKMKKMIADGSFEKTAKFDISADSPVNKESVLGAAPLDVLAHRVGLQSAGLQLASQSGDSANAENDFVAAPSDTDTTGQVLDAMILQNDLLFQQYLMNEQKMSLQAVSLSQKANSPSMTKLLNELRKEQR